MKLKNKISGEIKEFVIFDGNEMQAGVTLKDLAQEWEDFEEPKEYWAIDCFSPDGLISEFTGNSSDILENRKSIGNYFETKEEAEKAVERLRAWKRLKDKCFKFNGWNGTQIGSNIFYISEIYYEGCSDDMDLLFGGEE